MVKQKTIKTEISLTGVGLHTGKEVKMTFKPAPQNNELNNPDNFRYCIHKY